LDKIVTCIACPVGCEIRVHVTEKGVIEIQGNRCKRGFQYAKDEVLNPRRVLTMSVKVENGEMELLSVKTDISIPKKIIPKAIDHLKKIKVNAPVRIGDVIVKDLLGTGVKVVATRTILRK